MRCRMSDGDIGGRASPQIMASIRKNPYAANPHSPSDEPQEPTPATSHHRGQRWLDESQEETKGA